jgi:aldehyde:ferredoxin oxidoreductase
MLHAEGPLLTVDVGTGESRETDIDDTLEREIGGRALATALAHERIPFDADPFGAENRLYLTSGPLQASGMSFTGRMNLTGLSPLTDGLASTNAGGYVSRNFTGTGYSAVEFTGESDELVALHVTDEGVTREPVPELAGAEVSAVSEYMEDEHGLGSEHCVTIGPAGENLVRFASVMTFDSRAFGRGGLGAVFGAKNVKCVTFDGDSAPEIEIPDPPASDVHREAATSDHMMTRSGTTAYTELINDQFSLPTRYFAEQSFEHAADIGGNAVEEKKYKKGACSACAFACKLPTRDEETGFETEGPEFETLYAFGSSQGVGDLLDVMKANELCDELGMDTISAGITVAAYLDSEDAFGDAELAREVTEKIARREGIGDTLAEGVARCHEELGVEDWTVKGLEFAGHDGRICHGQGLSYAVANRGADHMYAGVYGLEYNGVVPPSGLDGKAELVVRQENHSAFRDSGIVCEFGDVTEHLGEEYYEQLFGTDYEELLEVGARCVRRERHFNNQRGRDVEDDEVPYADQLPEFESERAAYYELRGWNPDGTVPETPEGAAPADD